jgi:hypothetical protein
MQNKNTPAEGKNSAQTESESALRDAACSPVFSDTPDTDSFFVLKHDDVPSKFRGVEFCRKLERERNHNRQLYDTECKDHAFIRKTLERVIAERDDALKASKILVECGDPKPCKIEEWRKAKSLILLENSQAQPPQVG